jgi:uncharacterized membrane protein YjfL (UPF0719 family)
MFITRVFVSLFEFVFSAVISVLVVYVTYRVFILANTDFDGEEQIQKGNIAVAILTAAIMVSSSWIIQQGLDSCKSLFKMYMTTPVGEGAVNLALLGVTHLVMAFLLAVVTISGALRLFGRLGRRMHLGAELQKGNIAVGILLAGVVVVVSAYMTDGVSSLAKSLLPQPSIGHVSIMK